jgi:hypothetical protein
VLQVCAFATILLSPEVYLQTQRLWHNLTSPKHEDMQIDVTSPDAPTSGPPDSVTFKGVTYNAGDWVHLANAEVPSKPVVAQVQKIEGYVCDT